MTSDVVGKGAVADAMANAESKSNGLKETNDDETKSQNEWTEVKGKGRRQSYSKKVSGNIGASDVSKQVRWKDKGAKKGSR